MRDREIVSNVISELGDIGRTVLTSLSRSLDFSSERDMALAHRKGFSTPTALGLLNYVNYAPDVAKSGHIAHTDCGTLSMVFCETRGLQVLMQNGEWMYAAPKPNCAVLNVGDSLTFLSGGKLRSSLHRVVPHADALVTPKRTIVYLMRPETEAIFTDNDGKQWKSVDWYNRKHVVLRSELDEQRKDAVLTQRKGYVGLVGDDKQAATESVRPVDVMS